MPELKPSEGYPWTSYTVDVKKLLIDHRGVISRNGGSNYKLGAKVDPKTAPADVAEVDCSGYTVYLLNRRGVPMQGGSQQQREWCERHNLKPSDYASACVADDALRIGILPVTATRKIGHVFLIHNGWTIESRGGPGPDRRRLKDLPWARECKYFVIARPR